MTKIFSRSDENGAERYIKLNSGCLDCSGKTCYLHHSTSSVANEEIGLVQEQSSGHIGERNSQYGHSLPKEKFTQARVQHLEPASLPMLRHNTPDSVCPKRWTQKESQPVYTGISIATSVKQCDIGLHARAKTASLAKVSEVELKETSNSVEAGSKVNLIQEEGSHRRDMVTPNYFPPTKVISESRATPESNLSTAQDNSVIFDSASAFNRGNKSSRSLVLRVVREPIIVVEKRTSNRELFREGMEEALIDSGEVEQVDLTDSIEGGLYGVQIGNSSDGCSLYDFSTIPNCNDEACSSGVSIGAQNALVMKPANQSADTTFMGVEDQDVDSVDESGDFLHNPEAYQSDEVEEELVLFLGRLKLAR
jgi:hypothetical protein